MTVYRRNYAAITNDNKYTAIECDGSSGSEFKNSSTENLSNSESEIVTGNDCYDDQLSHDNEQNSLSYSEMFIDKLKRQVDKEVLLKDRLRKWALQHRLSHRSVSELLHILHNLKFVQTLPKDARSLLQTPICQKPDSLQNGEYIHLGLNNCLQSLSKRYNLSDAQCIEIQINIDGIPLSSSSQVDLWPILGRIIMPVLSEVFTIGIHCGKGKPVSVNDYLVRFVKEIKDIREQGGLLLNEKGGKIPIVIKNFVCDAPARAFLKMTRGHNYHQGCDKCFQEGEYVDNRMTFQFKDIASPVRLDEHFSNHDDFDDYFIGNSSLLDLNIGMVNQFPFDYMHMVCLGNVRRIITSWKVGNRNLSCRLGSTEIKEICARQELCRKHIPSEFQRRCRSIDLSDRWKATECRQFLLYVGPVVLKGIATDAIYNHFMLLFVAISCLCSQLRHKHYADYCSELLKKFVKDYASLYGKEQIVYNVHGLLHLCDDSKKFGALDEFSAFPYESYLGRLKKLVRKRGKTVSQLSRRLLEIRLANIQVIETKKGDSTLMKKHNSGPLLPGYSHCNQYKKIHSNGRIISCETGDCCFRCDDPICYVINIVKSTYDEKITVFCRAFRKLQNFFLEPLPSSDLGIWVVSDLSHEIYTFPLNKIMEKYVLLPYDKKTSFVAMPMLHSV